MSAALAEVLARRDVWRGDGLARTTRPGLPTGFPELDAELPGGGWPRGGLVELLPARAGIGELSCLLPALARVTAEELAWAVCVAPPHTLYAPAWAAAGIALGRLLVTRAQGGDAAWACLRVLDTEGVGALLAWLPQADDATLRRLHLALENRHIPAFVFRPAACAGRASPAPLRLLLDAAGGRLALRFLKRRGAPRGEPLLLTPPRPRLPVREGQAAYPLRPLAMAG